MGFDFLYDEVERPLTRYVSYVAKKKRYDFVMMYTQLFEGKTIVMCLQTMRMVMLSREDLLLGTPWTDKLDIAAEDLEVVTAFFRSTLGADQTGFTQY